MNRRRAAVEFGLVAALAGILVGTFAGPAQPAYAHAQLVGTTPANGARLDTAPAEVVLRFSERVVLVRDGIRLLDATGSTVGGAGPARIEPSTPAEVRLPVPAGLGTGTYTVSWRVASADSHPIQGAFVFGVGDVTVVPLPDGGAQAAADPGLAGVFWLFRWLGYAGLALLAGGVLFLFLCWPAGWTHSRARRILLAGWLVSVSSAVAVLLLQGPYAAGRTLGSVADPALLAATAATDFGRYVIARLVLLALFIPLVALRRPQWTFVVPAAALPITWIGTGHANADASLLARLSDATHLAAMSAWFGGLAVLVAAVLPGLRPLGEVAGAVTRFSRLATVCVGVLVVTGTYQAWRGVGSLAALAGSGYGRLLVFKLGAVGVLLWFGAMSRSLVQRRYVHRAVSTVATPELVAVGASSRRGPGQSRGSRRTERAEREQEHLARRQLGWSVRIEVAIGLAVLAITSLLVATPPGARPAAAAAAPAAPVPTSEAPPAEVVGTDLELAGGGRVYVQLDPARVGNSTLIVTILDAARKPWDVPEVTASLTLAAQGIGPLPVTLRKVRPGDYISTGLELPLTGIWQLQVKVRTSDIDLETVRVDMRVG
jgi:copper transport protein